MIEAVIDYINSRLEARLPYMTGNTHNVCRKAYKISDKVTKTYPAVLNLHKENCNTDKEVYVMPDRGKKSVVWWEVIGHSKHDEVNSRLNSVTVPVRLYIWLNADKINKDELRSGSYMSDVFASLPIEIPRFNNVYHTNIKNIRFKQSGDDFKAYSFDKMMTTRPYICLSVDMDVCMYVNRTCQELVEVKEYDECGGLIP